MDDKEKRRAIRTKETISPTKRRPTPKSVNQTKKYDECVVGKGRQMVLTCEKERNPVGECTAPN